MAKNAYPYFRTWNDVPGEERYGGTWVARHIAEMRAQYPVQHMWQDEVRCAAWERDADAEIERRLSRLRRCVAAVLWTSTENVWAPCPYRRIDDSAVCRTHHRMAGPLWAPGMRRRYG